MKTNKGKVTNFMTLFTSFCLVFAWFLVGCSSVHYPYMLNVRKSINPSQIHQSPQCKKVVGGRKKLVVFVHGALGKGTTTWGKLNDRDSWPMLMQKDNHYDGFDIFVYGYDTSLLSYSSNITELATQLNNVFENCEIFKHYDQVHFLTHSMGGLIVKRMLTSLHFRGQKKDLRKVRTVFFQGTPASGSYLATWVSWFSPNPQFGNLRDSDINAYLQTLEQDWQDLLRERKKPLRPFPLVYCSLETKGIFLNLFIVDRIDAKTLCDNAPLTIDADHIDMVKPAGQGVEPYLWTKRLILDAAAYDKAFYNNRVVIMDASLPDKVYSAQDREVGATNADSIYRILTHDLSHLELQTIKELVHYDWDRDAMVKRLDPSLIIIHLSSFAHNRFVDHSKEEERRKYREDVIGEKLIPFINNLADTNASFLIYSRIHKTARCVIHANRSETTQKKEESDEVYQRRIYKKIETKMNKYPKNQKAREEAWKYLEEEVKKIENIWESGRVELYKIPPPATDINGGCATFDDPTTKREFVGHVKELLKVAN